MNSIIKSVVKITGEISQLSGKSDAKQDGIQHMKERLGEVLKKKRKNKIMLEQYIRNMDRQLISEEDTFLWLSKTLKAGTESKIVAAQDQALNTKYYATKILHTETDSKCRLCQQLDETIENIISACPILAKEQCVKRHDKVPKSVVTIQGGKVTILWNQQVQTDRTIPSNKPDIIIRDNEKGTCIFNRCSNPRRQKCD
jgi:hypothetical protein